MKTLIFHRDGFFFFTSSRSVDWYQKKNTPSVTSQIPLFFGGYLSKMLGYLRHASQAKMEWRMDFFVSNSKAFFDGIN